MATTIINTAGTSPVSSSAADAVGTSTRTSSSPIPQSSSTITVPSGAAPCPVGLASAPSGQVVYCIYTGPSFDTPAPYTTVPTNAITVWSSSNSAASTSLVATQSSTPPASTTSPATGGTQIENTAQASPTASSKPETHGVTTAALAGTAVGCFLAGLFLAGAVAFLLFKKRSGRDRYATNHTYNTGSDAAYSGEKSIPMVSIAPVQGLQFLPQQADDAEVQRKLSTIVDQIDQHVENFYNNQRVGVDGPAEDQLSRFETSLLPQPIVSCFMYASNPSVLIKHCLAYHIINLTLAPGEGTQPLLPPSLAGTVFAVYNKLLSRESSTGMYAHTYRDSADFFLDTINAFGTWKALTRYLQPDLAHEAATSRGTTESSARIASHFANVFSPWANLQFSEEQRSRHLRELIANAVQTGVWLFGQPDMFQFDWSSPDHGNRTSGVSKAVIVPAVVKITYNGARLARGQRILDPVVRRF